MIRISPIFKKSDMLFCSVPVPPIDNHKDGDFDFTETQISRYNQSQTHPSIVYVEGGWNGHEYWLATTPYPSATGVFENPCIYYGDADADGNPPRVFYPISGTPSGDYVMTENPVVRVPNTSTVNSDPDLVYDDITSTMWLISRENTNNYATYAQCSLTGQAWSKRTSSFLWKFGVGQCANLPELLSPSILRVDNKYIVYCLTGNAGLHSSRNPYTNTGYCWGVEIMEGTTLEDGGDFTHKGRVYLTGKRDIEPWHMDVILDSITGKYYMICCAQDYNCRLNGVYLAESSDGIEFYMYAQPLLTQYQHYRPTMCITSDRKLVIYWCTEYGASTNPDDYPNGTSDISSDGRVIGVSCKNFDDVIAELKSNSVYGYK